MPPIHPDWSSMTQQVLVTNKLIRDSTCPGNNCGFTYSDEISSPTLNSLPSASVVSGTGTMTLSGTNYNIVANS